MFHAVQCSRANVPRSRGFWYEEPHDVKELEQRIAERIEPVDILDVLVDTENWINWARFFGPISGHDAKIAASQARYVATAFCFGYNLGPSQTARSLEGYDRRQIAWVDQRHVTEAKLDEAITALINAYNRFSLPKCCCQLPDLPQLAGTNTHPAPARRRRGAV
jgi:hypothetical protein